MIKIHKSMDIHRKKRERGGHHPRQVFYMPPRNACNALHLDKIPLVVGCRGERASF
jgi:hypothetical protein